MKIYSEELDRLEQLRGLFKKRPEQSCGINPNLSSVLTHAFNRAHKHFLMINEAYDESAHQKADETTAAFICEINDGIDRIHSVFSKIKYE